MPRHVEPKHEPTHRKKHHHAVVIDAEGKRPLSHRVMDDESDLLQLVSDVLEISGDVLWAVDINTGIAALATGLLLNHGQPVAHLTGRAIHQVSTTYRGEGRTDARDAFVIADRARIRRDVSTLRPGDDIALGLRLLTARRLDVVHDRTRQINRLRAQLLEFFPALERALDSTKKGPVLLLTAHAGAEFIAATGGDLTAFNSPDRLAGFAGLAPVPWDSGKVSGNLRRPRCYHRGLQRALCLSTQVALFFCPVSEAYYDRRGKEGKGHKQAVLALARRRVNVLRAMIRDHTPFQAAPVLA